MSDKGYMSGKNLRAAHERGEDLLGPPMARQSPQKQLEGGLLKEAFMIDYENKVATCPNGEKSLVGRIDAQGNLQIRFNTRTCLGCPLREKCCTGKEGRRLQISSYEKELKESEEQFKRAEIKAEYKRRGGIEACLSHLVSKFGVRRTRYKGQQKNDLRMVMVGVGVNLKRAARHLAGIITPARKEVQMWSS